MRSLSVVVAVLIVSFAPPLAAQQSGYVGRWVLKEFVSETGQELDSAIAPRRGPRSPVVSRLNADQRRQVQLLVGMGQPSRSIEIVRESGLLAITYNDEFTFLLLTDGSVHRDSLGETPLEIRARWKDRALEVEFKPAGGGKYVERYVLADSQLYLLASGAIDYGPIRGGTGWNEVYRKIEPR